MKELKFTPENLERHLKRVQICTTRDKPIGKIGTVVKIKGVGYFAIDRALHYNRKDLNILVHEHWYDEGFLSKKQFYDELVSIYPDSQDFYVLFLKEVFIDDF